MRWLAVLPLVCLFLTGCARVENSGTLTADGGLERKLKISVPAMQGMDDTPLPKSFVEFSQPGSWRVTESKKGEESILEAVRTLPPGHAAEWDFRINDGSKDKAAVRMSAVKLPDGTISYTETWTWLGGPPESTDNVKKVEAALKKHLAPMNATDAQVQSAMSRVQKRMWRELFGPGNPIVATLMLNPSDGLRRLNRVGAEEVLAFLKDEFPATPEDQRRTIARAFAREASAASQEDVTPKPQEAQASQGNSAVVTITTSIKGPGSLVESNGTYNFVEDDVSWSMFLEACQLEPVVLRAVFKP